MGEQEHEEGQPVNFKTCPVCLRGISRVQPHDGRIRFDCGSLFLFKAEGGLERESVTDLCFDEAKRILSLALHEAHAALMRYTGSGVEPVPCLTCGGMGWNATKKEESDADLDAEV